MSILVYIQHDKGKVLKGSLVTLEAALQIKKQSGKDVVAACLGEGAKAAAETLKSHSLSSIYVCEQPVVGVYRAEPYARAVAEIAAKCGAVFLVGLASTQAKDFFPRLAARLDAGMASDISGVNADGSFRRPMYAGNIFGDVVIDTPIKLVTVRGTAFSPAAPAGGQASVQDVSVSFGEEQTFGSIVSSELTKAERPELTEASVVISGGRALQSAENFEKVLYPLADVLGAAVGASRAAVDSGYAPNDWQVGQTGKVVAPNLYIAVGISGAIQHLAGMKDSKVVVAINKDGDAPIFEVADYGLVGDLFQIVPELTEQIKRIKAA